MGLSNVFKLIILSSISCRVYINAEETLNSSVLWCRFCNAAVGDTSAIFNILSPGAMKVERRYMFGRNITVQSLANPFHFVFEVLTTKNATCINTEPRADSERSWFPGYSWSVCICPRCSRQLGWTFERELTNDVVDINGNKTFHALMLGSLLGLTADDNPGVGMLDYLKYSKPFKTSSSLPPIRLRASDDTTPNEENSVTPLVAKNNTNNSKTTVVTETYDMNNGNLAVPTTTSNVTKVETNIITQTTSKTLATLANTQTSVPNIKQFAATQLNPANKVQNNILFFVSLR